MPPHKLPLTTAALETLLPLSLKASELRLRCHALGLPSTGTKPVLRARLTDCLATTYAKPAPWRGTRILSIDMGIKNLAYSLVTVPAASAEDAGTRGRKRSSSKVTIGASATQGAEGTPRRAVLHSWARESVLELLAQVAGESTVGERSGDKEAVVAATPARRGKQSKQSVVGVFTPALLARAAVRLVKERLLLLRPDIVLVERQRFRSANQAMVQEWTLRVNMLEAMVFAALETLRTEGVWSGRVESVSPKGVVGFWLRKVGSEEGEESKRKSTKKSRRDAVKTKDELDENLALDEETEEEVKGRAKRKRAPAAEVKKQKIRVMANWLRHALEANTPGAPLQLEDKTVIHLGKRFLDKVDGVRRSNAAAQTTTKTKPKAKATKNRGGAIGRPKKGENASVTAPERNGVQGADEDAELHLGEDGLTKLDDLADCVLQAIAWVRWEENKERMLAGKELLVGR